MKRPPIIWQEPGLDWAARLRGRRYFEGLYWLGRLTGQSVQISPPGGGAVGFRPGTVLFRYMPVDWAGPSYVRLVADVTGDVLGLLDEPTPAMAKAWAAKPPEDPTFWTDPDRLRAHVAMLKRAALVTTSWAALVEPLIDLVDCPVVHLPDYQGRWGGAFRRGMREVWRELQ